MKTVNALVKAAQVPVTASQDLSRALRRSLNFSLALTTFCKSLMGLIQNLYCVRGVQINMIEAYTCPIK